ncbi:DUF1127 domain-containing protein [Benzoatithermus flavus]|uniref:DUF1127 domain-containing protein n=1 Tax=Benzoatithermus flavus TaxID=3108223 RepID=A0ABU8XSS2_9PROT
MTRRSTRGASVRAMLERVACWQQRRRTRRLLWQLDERELQDIGLSRADVWAETRKPFWRA